MTAGEARLEFRFHLSRAMIILVNQAGSWTHILSNKAIWTPESIAELSIAQIKSLRLNAEKKKSNEVTELCDAELVRRAPRHTKNSSVGASAKSRRGRAVIGYHFVCPREKGVTVNGDGTAWTGTWVVERGNADRSTKVGAYVALHTSKSEVSYLQGNIRGWRIAKRDREYADGRPAKIEFGVDFLLELTNEQFEWKGDGAGEKGYVWGPA
jgi:hypothetical protein